MLKAAMTTVFCITTLALLTGCTITGEPKSKNVAFSSDSYVAQNRFINNINVEEVSDFPGTGTFTYGGRLSPNYSNDTFKDVLELSLANTHMLGQGFTLNAKFLHGGAWDSHTSLGENSRLIKIRYELKDDKGMLLFDRIIESEVVTSNYNFFYPYHLKERESAEKSYAQNIVKLLELINSL